MTYQTFVLKQLKEQGFRLTQARQRVTYVLSETHLPLSAYEIWDRLKVLECPVDKVSVYRTLECLEKLHLVHRVGQQGKYIPCHHEDTTGSHSSHRLEAHPVLLCDECGQVEEPRSDSFVSLLEDIQKRTGFKTRTIHLEFQGLCANCGS